MFRFGLKKFLTLFCVLWVFGMVFIILTFIKMGTTHNKHSQINHFSNISLCSQLDDYIVDDEPLADKYIEGVEYVDSYTYTLCYDDVKFRIYAYEFENANFAKEYYYRLEKKTFIGDADYIGSHGLFSSKLSVIYKNNVYRLETGNIDEHIKVMQLLNSIFDINISD